MDDIYKTLHRNQKLSNTNPTKNKQWSTKHYTETKDWETRTPLKPTNDLQNTTQKPKTGQHELH
jgi:hypothetical protein